MPQIIQAKTGRPFGPKQQVLSTGEGLAIGASGVLIKNYLENNARASKRFTYYILYLNINLISFQMYLENHLMYNN